VDIYQPKTASKNSNVHKSRLFHFFIMFI
jgi:hypothetical protein